MAKNASLNGKGTAQNGTQQASVFSPFSTPQVTNPKGAQPKGSRVAPADALPRPDHETLGGPFYLSSPICRETDAPVRMAEDMFRLYEADVPPRVLQLRFMLDSARYMARIYRKARKKIEAAVRERQSRKGIALTAFCTEAATVRAALAVLVAKPVAQLDKVIEEIAQADRVAATLHAQPGVPPTATINATVAAIYQEAQQSHGTSVRSESTSIFPDDGKRAVVSFTPARTKRAVPWIYFAMAFVGTLFGISVAVDRQILDLQAAKELEPTALVWLVYAMMFGAVIVCINHRAAFVAFRGAGERAAGEGAVNAPIINWKTLRHTIIPLFGVVVIASIEAVITRDAYLKSNWLSLPDPENPLHYLSGLLFLLPTAIIGATEGWREGGKNILRRKERAAVQEISAQQAEQSAQKTEAREQKEEKTTLELRDSEPAQWAQAWDTYISKLHQRKAELMAEIARLSQPYEKLIAQWEAAFLADPEITADELRILQAAREDAVAAYAKFMLELERLRQWQEKIEEDARPLHLNLTINRGTGSSPTPAAPVSVAKLSFWQRIVRFFRRLFGGSDAPQNGVVA